MSDFNKKILAAFIEENWTSFLAFIDEVGMTEDDASEIIDYLKND